MDDAIVNTFYNPESDIADDALDGLIRRRNGAIRRLPRGDQTRVVVRAELDRGKVAVVSGGGAGHEPLHAGLVGAGLLHGAVSGGVFASPSADAVLRAVMACGAGGAGVLLVVKNYTGDTLNFRLGAVRARARGVPVAEVVVRDDVALGGARPRGVAGTALVHKVAAYYADAGAPLPEVAAMARLAVANVHTIGVARTSCTLPGVRRAQRIAEEQVEVGIGIHGERGAATGALGSAKAVINDLCSRVSKSLPPGGRYAVLFNNLGGLSVLESMLLYNELTAHPLFARVDYVAGPAFLVTSLDMAGFSLSFIKLEDPITTALLAPVSIPEWPKFEKVTAPPPPLPHTPLRVDPQPSSNPAIRARLEHVLNACIAAESHLNELDSSSGDGDTGLTVARAAKKLLAAMDDMPFNEPSLLLAHIGVLASQSGGTLGGIVGVLLEEAARTLPSDVTWESSNDKFGDSLMKGLKAVCEALASKPGDRTIIDALHPAVTCLRDGGTMQQASVAARSGADSTTGMKAAVGRAAYVPEEAIRGVVDPGAEAAAVVFASLSGSE